MTLPTGKLRFHRLSTVAIAALSLPHSNADPERCFSILRKIQTDQRGNLCQKTINSLLSVKFNMDKADHKKLLVCCAPTYPPKLALPKTFYGHFEENVCFLFFFFKNLKKKDSFSQNYSFQNLFYVLTMFYYTVLTSIYPILNNIHLLI